VEVSGRNGEVLSRRRKQSGGDKFALPPGVGAPAGWTYQWNAVTVTGKEMVTEQMTMYQNGWRPVPGDRHPGIWFPPDYKGEVIVDGLRLEERPESLSAEAAAEDKDRARRQVRDQTDVLKLTQKSMPGADVAARRRVGGMSMTIDPAFDVPLPAYDMDDGSE